jgi:hypothetical protein
MKFTPSDGVALIYIGVEWLPLPDELTRPHAPMYALFLTTALFHGSIDRYRSTNLW